jgi:hypothetical protein
MSEIFTMEMLIRLLKNLHSGEDGGREGCREEGKKKNKVL